MSEGVDADWLEGLLVRKSREEAVVRVLEASCAPATPQGENYASTVLRVRARVRLGSGGEETRSFVLKRRIRFTAPAALRFNPAMNTLFNSECYVYSSVLPVLDELLRKTEGYSKLWPDFIGSVTSKDLCLADLKELGFRTGNRKEGLGLEEALLAVEGLAQFHAASEVALASGDILHYSFRPYLFTRNDEMGRSMLSSNFEMTEDVVRKDWGPEWSFLADKLLAMSEHISDTLHELGKVDPSRRNVLNHGDCWVNNIMFSCGYRGIPSAVKLLDFQICHYNSFGWDLTYLLNTSLSADWKAAHLDALLAAYVARYGAVLSRLAPDRAAPTASEVTRELARLLPFAAAVAVSFRAVIMSDSEDVLQLDELILAKGKHSKKRNLYNNPIYVDTLKKDLTQIFSVIDP